MVYKWYILPIGGFYATYHLLGEPETTIDVRLNFKVRVLRGNGHENVGSFWGTTPL